MSVILQNMRLNPDLGDLDEDPTWDKMSEKDFYMWLANYSGKQRKEAKLAFLEWYYAEYLNA